MGGTKIVPNLDIEQFDVIIKSSLAYKSHTITDLWSKCRKPIYHLTKRTQNLGLGEKGVTTFFSDNCTDEDSDLVTEWLKLKKMDAYLCRTFKTETDGRKTFEIKLASVEQGDKDGITAPPEQYKGSTFVVTRGDFSPFLSIINSNLAFAKKYAANKNQERMIEYYIKSFNEGNLDAHKEGAR